MHGGSQFWPPHNPWIYVFFISTSLFIHKTIVIFDTFINIYFRYAFNKTRHVLYKTSNKHLRSQTPWAAWHI